jgi:isocitrate/isopropylmalate dehydrogenase
MSTRICVFPGDDAAATAVHATVDVLHGLDADLELDVRTAEGHESELLDWEVPEEFVAAIDEADTVLFGSCNEVHTALLWYLRREYGGGMPANLRPIRHFEGAKTPLTDPDDIDYLIIRENLEGIYFRAEGDLPDLAKQAPDIRGMDGRTLADLGEGAYAIRVASERHTERFGRLAADLAAEWFPDRDRVSVTCASKSNVLARTDGLFDEYVEAAVRDHDRLDYEHLHTDDVAQRLVTDPGRFDAIVTPNFAGDLLSDGAAGTTGGLGVAPSGCYNEEVAYFEPVHGSAPDIAGEGVINPTATMLSAVMLLEHQGLDAAADRLRTAVEAVYAAGEPLTPDQGGSASTEEFAAAVEERL